MKVTKIIFNLLLFSCISSAFKLLPFNTLTEILNYQKAISEYPKIDNQDYINPDFSSFYKESEQSPVNRLITKALNFLKVKKELWSPEQFNSLLKKVTELQEKNWGTGDYVIKNTPANKTKFVIWGDIQGAFHSLARGLSKLKDENYLDDELKILNPDSFFIFNGNAIGRSAYIMETLTVILSLIEKNPKQVIYIKGEQELNDNWKNFGLEQELRSRATQISKENIPLENEITKFLNTLPLALYIKLPSDKIQKFIRISYFDRNFIKLNEFLFSEFLQKNSGYNVDVLKLADKKASDKQINIEAIIEGKDRSLQYQKTDGLQLLLPDKGATAWSILSSPTLSSQKLYNFSNDAFAILTVDPKEKLNLITLYKQNAIELKGFSTKTYNLLSEELIKEEAVKVEKAATKEEKITIGSSLDLFGVSYIGVIQIYQGINLFFKKLNSSGGIKGKEINYIVLNDQYQPALAIKNINTFLDVYKTNVILVIGGTPTTKAVLPRVEAKEILVAFPFSGASIFRKPELTNFIHMKTSYEKECFALTDYAINQMKLTKFAILYQDDDFGQECLKGTKEALEKNNIKNWLQTPHKNDTQDIEAAAKKIIDFNPQAIMLFSREKPSLYLIDQLGAAASNKTFFAGSYMFDEFKEQLNKKGAKIVLSNMVPNPKGTDLEIQREYQKDMQQMAGKEISYNMASLTGYIYAAVFAELLKRIDGEITKEKIIEQAEKIKNENFKGLNLNFDPQTRELFKEIWINTLEDKWVKPGETEVAKPIQKEIPKPEEKREIQVGLNMDLTNVLASEAKPTIDGISDYLREENKINKTTNFKLTILDNKLDTKLIESNTEKLLETGIKIFLQPTGSMILEKMLPFLKDKAVFILNGTQSPIFRKPDLKNLINYFPSSFQSSSILIEYLIEKSKDKKIAIIYQLEPYGQGAYEGCLEIFKKNNFQENDFWKAFGHPVGKTDDPKLIDSVKKFDPDIIFIASYDTAIKDLTKNLGADFLINKIIAIPDLSDEIKDFMHKQNLSYISTQMIPNLNTSNFELVKEYRNRLSNKKPDERYFEGYFTASLLVNLINKTSGEITPQKLLETAENIKNQNLKGFNLSFEPQTRSIFTDAWIDPGNGETFLYKPKVKAEPSEKIPTSKRNIVVGSNLDFTTVMSEDSKPTVEGILSAFHEENKISQTNNIKFTYYDNKFQIDLIKDYTQKMLDTGINIFLQPTGSFILEKMLPMIKDKPIFMLSGATSPIFRSPELKNFINYFPSSFQSTKALAEYLIGKLNKRKIAVIYQLEPYGQGAFDGSEYVFKKYNLKKDTDWIAFGHQAEEISNPKIVAAIKKFNPDALIFATYDAALRDLVNNLGADFLFKKTIGVIEISGGVKDFFIKKNISFISTQLVPDAKTSDLELAKECLNIIGHEKISPRALEGYVGASILIYLINRVEGKVTPQKLLNVAENLKNENFKGLVLNFDPQYRSILNDVWIDTGDGKAFIYKETEEEKKEIKKPEMPKLEEQPKIELKTKTDEISTEEKRTIQIGVNLDLSSVLASQAKPGLNGITIRAREENAQSKINDIKLTHLDNELDPIKIKSNTEELLGKGINVFLQPAGSFILDKMLPLLKDKSVFIFNGTTSPIFRKPELKNLINYFASSYQSATILTEYIIKELKKNKIAIIYQLEPFAQGAFEGCKNVLEKHNLKENSNWIALGHELEKIDDPNIIKSIKEFNPDVIIMVSFDAAMKTFINFIGVDFLYTKIFTLIEGTTEIKKFLSEKNIKYISTHLVPNFEISNLKIAQEYRKAKNNKNLSEREFEGYFATSLLLFIIDNIKGSVTPQKLLEFSESLKNQDWNGFNLNFDPKTRSINSDVWLDAGDGKLFLYKETKEEKKELTAPLKPEEVSKSKKEVLVGTTLDLSKSNSVWGKAILNGLNLSINKANREGGINGKNIKLIHFDNKNDPKIAKEDAENILNKGSDLILHPVGNLTIEAYLPLAKENKLAIIFSASSAATLYKPEPRNMTSFYPSSKDAGKVISEYAIKEHNMRKIAVFFQTEPYSLSALEGAKEIFKNYNLIEGKDWIAVSHIPDSLDLTQATNRIKEFNPSAIFIFSVYSPNQALINQLGTNFLYNKILFGLESDGKIINSIRKQNLKFATTQLLPNPEYDLKIAQEYRTEKANEDLNDTEFGAFIACEIFIDILRKMKEIITKEKIIEAIENIKNYNFRGINLNFDPNTRKILQDVWINKVDGLLISYKIPESKIIEQAIKPEEIKKVETPLLQVPMLEKKAEKMTNNEIKVGCTLDQNGKTAEYIKTFAIGLKTKISKVNSTGGINGKTISLIIRDDEFSPGKAAENIEKFLSEDKTDIILSPFGSFPFTEILPFVKEQKIAVFFPEATSPDYQKKEYKNLVTCFGSSYQESKVLFEYIINKLKIKKIAIFYEEEPFSQGAFNGAKYILEKNNLKENVDWKVFPREIQTKSAKASTKEILEILQNFDPQGIALLSLHSTTQALILDIPRDYLASKKCFGISSMSKVKKMLEDRGLKFISTQLVPDPINSTLELVKEYRKDMSEKGISLDTYSLEGYFAASIFVNLLRKIEGKITKEKILEQAEKIKNYDFKGLTLNFDPATRNIFGCVFLDTKEGEPILYKPEIEKPKEISVEKPIEIKPVITPTSKEPSTEKTVAATIPTTKEDFVVGNSMDLSKGGAHWGKADLKGILLSINKTNREGGVNGRKMKLINYDDKNDPNLAFENVQNLIKKEIDFIIHPFGGTSIQKYLPLIKENKIAVIFSASSDDTLYKPEPKYLTNFFLSAKDTAKTITEYAIKELNLKKFAVFYEMDSYSQSALDGAIEIFKKFNLQEGKDWISEGHQPDVTDVLPSANKIKDFSPQGILLFSVYQAHTSLVDLLGAAFLNDKILLPLESDGEIIDALKKRNFKFATTQTLPSIDSDIEAAKQFKEELKKQGDDKTLKFLDTTFSAFIATELFVDIVKNLQKSITKENVIDAIEKIKDRDFRGIKMDFNPLTRAIFKNCYIYTTDGKVIPYSISAQANPSIATTASLLTASKLMAKNLKGSTLAANTRFINNKKPKKRRLLARAK